MRKIFVLRWGHRPRDYRLTTHVILTARAFGASGLFLSDVTDFTLSKTVNKVLETWGGSFLFEMGRPYMDIIEEWRSKGGKVVHLTMHGENIEEREVMERIRSFSGDILVLIGSQKVPKDFYSSMISDLNVAVGNQPHSEVAALAVFLDKLFEGKELKKKFIEEDKDNLMTAG